MDRSEYETMTVLELRDALSARSLPVYGSKAELVDRLAEADNEDRAVAARPVGSDKPPTGRVPARREVHAGGHVIVADVEPETPAPIVTCSVCGMPDGDCVHSGKGDTNPGWTTEEGA